MSKLSEIANKMDTLLAGEPKVNDVAALLATALKLDPHRENPDLDHIMDVLYDKYGIRRWRSIKAKAWDIVDGKS